MDDAINNYRSRSFAQIKFIVSPIQFCKLSYE